MPSAWRFKELPTAAGRRGGLYPPLPQLCGVVWRAEVVAPHKQRSTRGASGKPRPTIEGKPGSATTSRHPPTQAAKKCGIGPQVFPVPPAESPVDGAGPQRGVKTGRRITIWNHLTPSGAPFSLDSKNRSFSSREKETGFERSLWEHLTPPHPSWPTAMTPSPLRGEGFKRYAVSGPTNCDINHA